MGFELRPHLLDQSNATSQRLRSLNPRSILPFDLNGPDVIVLDFSESNGELAQIDRSDTNAVDRYVRDLFNRHNARAGIGGYGENRAWYQRSEAFFEDGEARTYHIGVDITTEAGTPIYAPVAGIVHSFRNNNALGDYGPTIILRHDLGDGFVIHSLFGHLSRESLNELSIGKSFPAGHQVATLGKTEENGHWPPHLHFQLIIELGNHFGDYPGVSTASQLAWYLANCPDPNLILRCSHLPAA